MRRGVFAILAAGTVLASAVQAEYASRPDAMPTRRIAVLGDSLAEGLWASLARHLRGNKKIEVINLTRHSTGFNSDGYDDKLAQLLSRNDVDLLIVHSGANDRQRVVDLDGKGWAAFGTDRWFEIYGQRLAYFFGSVQQRDIPVLWVGLPVMRNAPFNSGIRVIDSMHRDYAMLHGAQYLDLTKFTTDAEGDYIEFLSQPNGRKRRFRHEDGVHFWEFGYDRVAAHVIDAIRARYPDLLPSP
jgi:hypothetical protein